MNALSKGSGISQQQSHGSTSVNCNGLDCRENFLIGILDNYIANGTKQIETTIRAPEANEDFYTFRKDQWVPPLVILSSINIFMILSFELYVIFKAVRTVPSRRHLFLGQTLLFGLFICSVLGFVFTLKTNLITCILTRTGLGIGYSLVFGTLLVKTIFLLGLHDGTYLPALYQVTLLLFIFATQVAIEIQWFISSKPSVIWSTEPVYRSGHIVRENTNVTSVHSVQRCNHSINSLLFSLIYNIILIALVCIFSIKTRKYRENHRESVFIFISIITTFFLWITWICGSLVSNDTIKDVFIAYGVVLNAFLIFLVMFIPKIKQLSSLRRECLYYSKDDEELSTTSSPSQYTSPSFLHIKPNLLPFISQNKSNSNWNLYKRFNSPNVHQISPKSSGKLIEQINWI